MIVIVTAIEIQMIVKTEYLQKIVLKNVNYEMMILFVIIVVLQVSVILMEEIVDTTTLVPVIVHNNDSVMVNVIKIVITQHVIMMKVIVKIKILAFNVLLDVCNDKLVMDIAQ